MTDRDHVLGQGVAVDGDAEGRAVLVLAAVAAADGALLVVEGTEAGTSQHGLDLLGLLGHAVLLHQREDRAGDRGDLGVELEHHAGGAQVKSPPSGSTFYIILTVWLGFCYVLNSANALHF